MPRFSHSQPRRNNAISTRAFEKPRLKCQAKIQVALIFLKASSSKWSGIPRNMNEMMEPNEQFHIIIETSWQHPIKLFLPCKIGKNSLPSYQTLQPSPADSPARRTPCSLRSSSPNVPAAARSCRKPHFFHAEMYFHALGSVTGSGSGRFRRAVSPACIESPFKRVTIMMEW